MIFCLFAFYGDKSSETTFFWTIGSVILRCMIPRWHSISSTTQFKRCSVSDLVASSGEVVECNQLNILQPSN